MASRPRPSTVNEAVAPEDQHIQKRSTSQIQVKAESHGSQSAAWQSVLEVADCLEESDANVSQAAERLDAAKKRETKALQEHHQAEKRLKSNDAEVGELQTKLARWEQRTIDMKQEIESKIKERPELKKRFEGAQKEASLAMEEMREAQKTFDDHEAQMRTDIVMAKSQLRNAAKEATSHP